ncbi:ATP-dependent 6-phosphofructokinase [bacterium]|nr:ATP-dependent 6-phosphofructokinase [candidate division CSSED10-310 bacterium]
MKWLNDRLGGLTFPSPLKLSSHRGDQIADFVDDDARILVENDWNVLQKQAKEPVELEFFEKSGPRARIHFDPGSIRAAIVTCGGLCPGVNDVIRSLVMQLHYHYGISEILGIRYGFQGMSIREAGTAIILTPSVVETIHTYGGSLLGSSRGPLSPIEMVDFLQRRNIRLLFAIGGDGTLRGAMTINEECRKRAFDAAIVGIPKTIDNDIAFIDRSFGFSTAVEKATEVLACAHAEAHGAQNGIGLVKLMGRNSGLIAARSSIASGYVNFVLVPELPFDLDGDNGFLAHLQHRLETRGHAVIAVAEGAGQDLFVTTNSTTDASGNVRFEDIGLYLKQQITSYFEKKGISCTLKYIDPSYIIRSTPANTEDNIYCTELGQHAVHAAFAGRTGTVVGSWHQEFVMIPMSLATAQRKVIDLDGHEWLAVLQATGQPHLMKNT